MHTDLAERLGHDDVTPVHLALGLIREGQSIAVAALFNLGVPLDVLERELEAYLPPPGSPHVPRERAWTPSDERVLEQTTVEARELRTVFFGCEHVLLALLRDVMGAPALVLARHGVGFEDARTEVLRIYNVRPDEWTSAGASAV